MKKSILIIAGIVGSLAFVSCEKSNAASKVKAVNVEAAEKRDAEIEKGAATASFDNMEFNFGNITAGESVETTFVVTNTGSTDLVILDAKVTCGCTVPQWPRGAIAPGASEEIKVRFNSYGKMGRQSKNITLLTNTASGREILKIKGFVEKKS